MELAVKLGPVDPCTCSLQRQGDATFVVLLTAGRQDQWGSCHFPNSQFTDRWSVPKDPGTAVTGATFCFLRQNRLPSLGFPTVLSPFSYPFLFFSTSFHILTLHLFAVFVAGVFAHRFVCKSSQVTNRPSCPLTGNKWSSITKETSALLALA